MSGMALVIISPSSSRMMRRTPCVDGWDGPMLRIIFSPLTPSNSSAPVARVVNDDASSAVRAATSLTSISWVAMVLGCALSLFGLYGAGPKGLAVGCLDVFATLQPRVGLQRVR